MFVKYVLPFIVQFVLIKCANVNHERQARWFKTYTNVETETKIITSVMPSSCVLVDPTLPPCRNVRYMNFPRFITQPATVEKTLHNERTIHTTPLGWGEYLGLYAPTVTSTLVELRVATIQDPRILVTFAVQGCKPLKLPMGLDRCEVDEPSTVSLQEILPTSTVAAHETVPQTANYDTVQSIMDIIDNQQQQMGDVIDPIEVQGSVPDLQNIGGGATEPLP